MTKPAVLNTQRLLLRQWRPEDYPLFAAMNADPVVMEFLPGCLSRSQSDAMSDRIRALIEQQGWGLWALESLSTGGFIGFTGLHIPGYELPFTPCVEIGWRLDRNSWGQGYATEAATAALDFAFEQLHMDEIVSFTAIKNLRSQAVMKRLHMQNTWENFNHPAITKGEPLEEHVLYRISQSSWLDSRG